MNMESEKGEFDETPISRHQDNVAIGTKVFTAPLQGQCLHGHW